MIYVMSGGSGKLFAAIGVTYPAGSTVTCTNGTKTLTAKNTSGQWVFAIPEPKTLPETWTITATDGTNSKSETVEISAEGQSESVELTYGLVLFDGEKGVNNTAVTGSWSESGVDTFTVSSDSIYFALSDSGDSRSERKYYARTGKKIDLTKYSALTAKISSITNSPSITSFRI